MPDFIEPGQPANLGIHLLRDQISPSIILDWYQANLGATQSTVGHLQRNLTPVL